jgi:FkbM family methyltransferase
MRSFLKKVLPIRLQRLLYISLWNPLRRSLWKRMDLTWTLKSGLAISVENHADWTIYNEIFVSGEYDEAIHTAEQLRNTSEFKVLDLGANVGFFALRVAEVYLEKGGAGATLTIMCVEGSPRTCQELNTRLRRNSKLLPNFEIVSGLVGGRKQGQAYFSDEFTHYGNSIRDARSNSASVQYIDIEEHLCPDEIIDLLKCDIEGAEFDFVEVYEELLKRTRVLVIEIHRYGKDVSALRNCLVKHGLLSRKVLRNEDLFTVEMFVNPTL